MLKEFEEAEPLQELISTQNDEVVGWLYQWRSGRVALMWYEDSAVPYTMGSIVNSLHASARASYWEFLSQIYGANTLQEPKVEDRTCNGW